MSELLVLANTLKARARKLPAHTADLAETLATNIIFHAAGQADPALPGFIEDRLAELELALFHDLGGAAK